MFRSPVSALAGVDREIAKIMEASESLENCISNESVNIICIGPVFDLDDGPEPTIERTAMLEGGCVASVEAKVSDLESDLEEIREKTNGLTIQMEDVIAGRCSGVLVEAISQVINSKFDRHEVDISSLRGTAAQTEEMEAKLDAKIGRCLSLIEKFMAPKPKSLSGKKR